MNSNFFFFLNFFSKLYHPVSRDLYAYALSEEERDKWVASIQTAIDLASQCKKMGSMDFIIKFF